VIVEGGARSGMLGFWEDMVSGFFWFVLLGLGEGWLFVGFIEVRAFLDLPLDWRLSK
jgi:hypothetical protein